MNKFYVLFQFKCLVGMLCFLVALSAFPQQKSLPPKPKIILHADTQHQIIRLDPYNWMQNRKDPNVLDYLEKENLYAQQILAETKALQDKLVKEMQYRIGKEDEEAPYRMGSYLYFSRRIPSKEYPTYFRRNLRQPEKEEVLVDINELAKGEEYISFLSFHVSPDEKYIAYLVDNDGSERCSLIVVDIAKKKIINDGISDVSGTNFAWMQNSSSFLYTKLDSSNRACKLFRHTIGSNPSTDTLVYQEKDKSFDLWLSATKDQKFIILESFGLNNTETYFLSASINSDPLKILFKREPNIDYWVDHCGGKFIIRGNQSNPYFDVFEVSDSLPDLKQKKILVHGSYESQIDGFEIFKNNLVCSINEKGVKRLLVHNINNHTNHFIEMEEADYTLSLIDNKDFNSSAVRFQYTSLRTPKTIYDYNFETAEKTVVKKQEVVGYIPDNYITERLYAMTKDSVRIPISIVYKKEVEKTKARPMLLTAYGAYGISLNAEFGPKLLSLLDRGVIYAIAHVRGGGELGFDWFEQGKLLNKKNSFEDFIACTEFLINKGVTSPDKLVLEGSSAGGLLVGAVINLRPDLYRAAVATVPWVDVLNDLNAIEMAPAVEWEHLGNPKEKRYFDYILSYSPYDNVKNQKYPNLFVTCGLNDTRVPYWESAKWVAKIRAMKTNDNVVVLKTQSVGHSGQSSSDAKIKERAEQFAFILKCLGLNK